MSNQIVVFQRKDGRMDIQRQIELFATWERPCYKSFELFLKWFLLEVAKRVAPMGAVSTRTKKAASFAEKCLRKNKTDPVHEFTDLCGGRIVVHTRQEVLDVEGMINSCLEVEVSEDKLEQAMVSQFGYGSVHLDVSLGNDLENKLAANGIIMPEEVLAAVKKIRGPRKDGTPHTRKAEIQVRTDLQHVWADTLHDNLYKTGMDIPRPLKREASRLSAVLEEAGTAIDALVVKLGAFNVDHGAYMDDNQMKAEVQRLELILDQNINPEDKQSIVLRLAKIARSMRNWKKIIQLKERTIKDCGSPCDELRFFGAQALCRANHENPSSAEFEAGMKELTILAAPPVLSKKEQQGKNKDEQLFLISQKLAKDGNVSTHSKTRSLAMAELAQGEFIRKKGNRYTSLARDFYYQAHLLDTANPYIYARFLLFHAIDAKTRSFAIYMRVAVEQAISICREHASVGIELPFAHFTEGLLHALVGDFTTCLLCCARGIAASKDGRQIKEEIDLYGLLRETTEDNDPQYSSNIEMVIQTLRLGFTALINTKNETGKVTSPEGWPIIDKDKITGPVLIIAGTCDPIQTQSIRRYYESLIRNALRGFKGTVYCGGTANGIAGVTGDIAQAAKAAGAGFTLKAYMPEKYDRDKNADHPAYTLIKMPGTTDFTFLQPLQNWTDLLAKGVLPKDIRILGIGGGEISLFEYHLAVALGATVGIVDGSGRSGRDIINGESWWAKAENKGKCFSLPEDQETLWNFLNILPGNLELDKKKMAEYEPAARALHEKYVASATQSAENKSLAPWKSLNNDFRISNFHQAIHASRILEEYGLEISTIDPKRGEPIRDLAAVVGKEGIERLAEMEHGRWNVERLMLGWRYGSVKNIEEKINPCLVPWCALSDGENGVKKHDREPFLEMPKVMESAGLGIYRIAKM
jgi:ppGpp synthetase/RelA/SpoT-type nucleotidyltranferase